MDNARCAVLVPVFAALEPETEQALRELAGLGYVVRLLRGCSQIDLARSILATDALADGFAETLWIDADVVFTPDDAGRLRGHGRPFTAGLYRKKGAPALAGKFRPGTESLTLGAGGGLVEMEYVGFGFAHARAEVYHAMRTRLRLPDCGGGYGPARPVTPYFLPLLAPAAGGLDYLSEDYAFCHRARQVGYPVSADTTLRLGHVGRRVYTWDDLRPEPRLESLRLAIDERGVGT